MKEEAKEIFIKTLKNISIDEETRSDINNITSYFGSINSKSDLEKMVKMLKNKYLTEDFADYSDWVSSICVNDSMVRASIQLLEIISGKDLNWAFLESIADATAKQQIIDQGENKYNCFGFYEEMLFFELKLKCFIEIFKKYPREEVYSRIIDAQKEVEINRKKVLDEAIANK